MAEYITDVIDVPELIGYVREQRFEGLTLDAFLPNLDVDDIEYELRNIDAPNVQVARYRAWDTAPPLGKRAGFSVIAGEIPNLGLTMRLNEREFKQLQRLRAGTPGAGNLADTIWNDALQMVRAVQTRIELARGDLLTDGIVSINENGVNVTANFNVPGAHGVAAATPWSTTGTATPLTDLKAWLATYRSNNGGRNPDVLLTSSEVIGDLTLNAQIRNLAPVTGIVPGIITEETVAAVFRAQGFPPFVTYDTELPNLAGTMARVINARKVIALRVDGLGTTLYGTTADAEAMAGNGVIEMRDAPGVIAFAQQQIRPAAAYTTGAGLALPVLRDPKAILIATV